MTLIVLGILIIVTPYTGFPSVIRTTVLVICGVLIAGVGFLMRAHTLAKPLQNKTTEHHPFQDNITS